MLYKHNKMAVILIGFVLLGSLARAQDTNSGSQKPLQPISPLGPDKTVGGPVQASGDSSAGGEVEAIPDSHALAGAQELTLGSPAFGRGFLLPSFSAVTNVSTNPFIVTTSSHPATLSTSFFAGRLGVNRVSGRSELLLDYVSGGSFSNDPLLGNSLIQGLEATETIRTGRWATLFGDQLSYLSNSLFGSGGLGGMKNLGTSLGNGVGSNPGLSSRFAPVESFYLLGMPRINNTAIGQTTYSLTRRAMLTFVGSYSLLDFRNAPLQNSQTASYQVGYDYLLSRQNSISVFYRYDDFHFSNLTQGIRDHNIEAAFARRLTGRLSFQIGGGPSIYQYQNPLSGSGTETGPTIFAALKYQLRYTGFGFNYTHGLTNGGGILPGAKTDSFTGTTTRSLGRNWDVSLDGGYSRNQAVQQTLVNAFGISPSTWFVTTQVKRRFVAYGALFVSYNATGQSNLAPICNLPGCMISSSAHTVSLGYTWGLRPRVLE